MYKGKIQNMKDLEFYSAFSMATALVNKWVKLKPDNKELKDLSQSLVDIFFLVTQYGTRTSIASKGNV